MRKYADPRLMSADELARRGRARAAREPELYDRLVDATQGDAVAILCTTSGTTAHPKLAMLSAGRLLRHCAAYLAFDPKGPDDEYVSVLPLPWIMEQVYALGKALLCRMKVNFVEEARHDDARLSRDRPDLRAVRAARLGSDRRGRARPDAWTPRRSSSVSTTSA